MIIVETIKEKRMCPDLSSPRNRPRNVSNSLYSLFIFGLVIDQHQVVRPVVWTTGGFLWKHGLICETSRKLPLTGESDESAADVSCLVSKRVRLSLTYEWFVWRFSWRTHKSHQLIKRKFICCNCEQIERLGVFWLTRKKETATALVTSSVRSIISPHSFFSTCSAFHAAVSVKCSKWETKWKSSSEETA